MMKKVVSALSVSNFGARSLDHALSLPVMMVIAFVREVFGVWSCGVGEVECGEDGEVEEKGGCKTNRSVVSGLSCWSSRFGVGPLLDRVGSSATQRWGMKKIGDRKGRARPSIVEIIYFVTAG
ncbi:hypothetical protein VTJ04DRAFT_10893 [Mycothermus thermophilus]|uniref:uncharacterized protein n=1 Tax=Humicola insolens TaxID=85995 RepID=UPI003744A985